MSTLARQTAAPPAVALPLAGSTDAIGSALAELKALRTFVKAELRPGVDYGVVPGTGPKPTLLQPGAQKAAMYFNVVPRVKVKRVELGGGHLEVVVTCLLVSRATTNVVAEGHGSCSTMEKKYRVRNAARSCPGCGKAAIIRGKAEYGGGWLCHKKQGGCGAKFPDGDPRIESQAFGTVDNPDVWDSRNTVLKIAVKRAKVAAALDLGCLSELFTQDLDDVYDLDAGPAPTPRDEGREAVDAAFRKPEPGPAPAPAPPLAEFGPTLGAALRYRGERWGEALARLAPDAPREPFASLTDVLYRISEAVLRRKPDLADRVTADLNPGEFDATKARQLLTRLYRQEQWREWLDLQIGDALDALESEAAARLGLAEPAPEDGGDTTPGEDAALAAADRGEAWEPPPRQ